jgi:hypothetical protein
MAGYNRPEGGWNYVFDGINSLDAADAIQPTQYPYARNIRGLADRSVRTRPGYALVMSTPTGSELSITTVCPIDQGAQNVAYSYQLTATGGQEPYTWTIIAGSLPTGLTLNSSTGLISGTPTGTGTSNFTFQVADSDDPQQTDSLSCSVTITAAVETCLLFEDDFARPETSFADPDSMGDMWSNTSPPPSASNRNGVRINTAEEMTMSYVAGSGSGGAGMAADFATYATVQTKHPLLDDSDQLSEGDCVDNNSISGSLTRDGPACFIQGNWNAGDLQCYMILIIPELSAFNVQRVINTIGTNIGSTLVAGAFAARWTITVKDTGAATRIRVYRNGTLLYTFNDTDGSRLTSGEGGYNATFCSSGRFANWDNWVVAEP